jgi:L-amino acid N-acyltransferase YncA
MTFLIRPSTPADCAAIAAIYGHAVVHGTASWEHDPPELAEMIRRREALVSAGYPYLVAEANGQVMGYAYAGAYRPRPAYAATVEDSVYLAPAAQRRGIGTKLLATLIADCTALGYRQMICIIGDGQGGSAGSLALHESLGFALVGIARDIGYKHGRWLDQMILQKSLGAGAASPPAGG